jgi:hypothetical protein
MFVEDFARSRCAFAAATGYAELTPNLAQRAGALAGGFANLAVSDAFADADVHGDGLPVEVAKIYYK